MRVWIVALALVGCAAANSDPSAEESESANTAASCATLAAGPFTPESVGQLFNGSEDFAFDGKGGIVGKRGDALVRLDAQGNASTLAQLPGQTWGLRFHPNGTLFAAVPGQGKLVSISPSGAVSTFATGLNGPNGVFVDDAGNVWVTEFRGGKVVRFSPEGARTDVVTKVEAPNGVVIDAAKKVLYFTEYSKGKLHRLALDTAGARPELVATITGASLDGLTLDACGNVYALDQGRSRLYRVRDGKVEELASFPTNVANAQFGAGPGFEPTKLYVTGNPGTVYTLPLGVKGVPPLEN